MHIGLNLLYLLPGTVGGTETYAAGLLEALPTVDPEIRYTVFVNEECRDWPLPESPRLRRVVCPVRARSRLRRYRWEQLELPRLLRRPGFGVDLLHSLGYVAPLRPPCPSVVTIHDLNYRAFGNRMPLSRRLPLRLFVEQSARRAARVIAVSAFSRSEILRAVPLPPDRVRVVHEAPRRRAPVDAGAVADTRARLGLHGAYLVAFSSSTPNKNVPRLLAAYAAARRDHGLAHDLVLVGHPPADGAPADAGAAPGIHFTGYLDDASLAGVLGGAEGLLFPSTYEGFGLPVLEAMAAGVPVACSRAASLPEVAGDAALYFDPHSTGDIARAAARLAGDPELRRTLSRRGLARAAEFSWARAAAETVDVYRGVLAPPSGEAPLAPAARQEREDAS